MLTIISKQEKVIGPSQKKPRPWVFGPELESGSRSAARGQESKAEVWGQGQGSWVHSYSMGSWDSILYLHLRFSLKIGYTISFSISILALLCISVKCLLFFQVVDVFRKHINIDGTFILRNSKSKSGNFTLSVV